MGAEKCKVSSLKTSRLPPVYRLTVPCSPPPIPASVLQRTDQIFQLRYSGAKDSALCASPCPPPTQKSNTMTQMDCSHIKPQSKVYKALLNISNSCGTNTPEIKALQQQSECFTSVASKSHSPDACFQLCPVPGPLPSLEHKREGHF